MKTECSCETYLGEWLRKYDELERRLKAVREILSKYPKYKPPIDRTTQPFERIEILLSDIQELHALMDTPCACEGLHDKVQSGAEKEVQSGCRGGGGACSHWDSTDSSRVS